MDENNIYDVYTPEPEPTEEAPKRKRLPWWAVVLIVIAVLILIGTSVAVVSFVVRRIVKKVEFHAMPGGSITFSEANPAENVAKSALMAVVNIESSAAYNGFFGYSVSKESGSGAVIREDGYIITSMQLAEGEGDIAVKLQNGKKYQASVENIDSVNGVALLKIDATGLDTMPVGDSSVAAVGDRVAVVGNAISNNLTNPVTLGYICGVDNGVALENGNYINLFQVDASAIAGSVGGLVINAKGELIGISNGIISNSSTEIGLVTPVNALAQLIGGIVEVSNEAAGSDLKIGIAGTDENYGVLVSMVGEGTPAEKAGLKVDDLIVKVDGEAVTTIAKINEIKARHEKGDTIVVTVYRDGEMMDINVVL